MPIIDLHGKPFDETTIAKLGIFENYAQAWIPTFVMSGVDTICIFDFFAGTGYDNHGVEGSPIRILNKIREYLPNILSRDVKVKLYLNEWEPDKKEQQKFQLLEQACTEYLQQNPELAKVIELNFFNEDFEYLFPKVLPLIKKYPSLVYIDQNGVKFLADKYFLELSKIPHTDFIYFVSSSHFWRFGETDEFKTYLDLDMEAAKKDPYKFIHRNLIGQLRQKLPAGSKMRLYPFSLAKGTNIHGIIFGASHPLAADKFLQIAWKTNPLNGEANFDIDEDRKKNQLDIFGEKKLTKLEKFVQSVRNKVLSKEIKNNFEMLDFVYQEGHIGIHAADCLREMKKNKEIDYDGVSPLVTYDNVYKNNRRVDYKT